VLTSVVSLERIYASFDGDEDTYLRVGANAHGASRSRCASAWPTKTGFPHEGKLEFVDNQLDAAPAACACAPPSRTRQSLVPGLFARVQLAASAAPQRRS
jgi:multidrug efflux system membrane fusion protein